MLVRRFQSRRETRKSSRRGRTSSVQNARDIPKQFEKSCLVFRPNHRNGNLPSFEDLMQLLFPPTSLPWTSNYQNSDLHLYGIHSSPKSLPTLQCPRCLVLFHLYLQRSTNRTRWKFPSSPKQSLFLLHPRVGKVIDATRALRQSRISVGGIKTTCLRFHLCLQVF